MYNYAIHFFNILCLRVRICICLFRGFFKVSKVSSDFFLLLFYFFPITSKLCHLEDFGALKHPSAKALKLPSAKALKCTKVFFFSM